MRLFISINLPHQLNRYCTQLQSQFRSLKNAHTYHLTLQFLGNDIQSPEPIIDALSKIKFKPFDIEMGDAMPFPNPYKARGVWVECKMSDSLKTLSKNIRRSMSDINLKPDKPFKPHITLGRYKRPPHRKPKTVTGEPHTFTVDKFYLMESELTPIGPKYRVVEEFLSSKPKN